MRRFAVFLFTVLWMVSSRAPAQPGPPPGRGTSPSPDAQRPLFYEAVVVHDSGTATVRIDVLYRIDEQFFVPVKDSDPSAATPFLRRGEILLELQDSTGETRGRIIRSLTRPAADQDRQPPGRSWLTGCESLHVPPGPYTLLVELSDLESDRRLTDRTRTLRAPQPGGTGFRVAARFFYAGVDDSTAIVPQNLGPDVRFGSTGGLALLLRGLRPDAGEVTFTYALRSGPGAERGDPPPADMDTAAHTRLRTACVLLPERSGETVRYRIGAGTGPPDAALFTIPLPLETFHRRAYLLYGLVRAGEDTQSLVIPFRPLWPDMPLSLRDPEFALDALRHVTTPDQLDSLRRGSPDERRLALEQFWAPRDPTPGTAMNEVMTEYYRRVDRAMIEFATLREPDGSRTDRGRVYILHGPPTRRDRSLGGNEGNREIWTYETLGRRFVFVDELRTGNYTLSSTQGL